MSNFFQDSNMQLQAPNLVPNDQEALGLIQNCTKEELQSYLDNDYKLNDLINDLPQIKRIQTDKDMIIVKNKSTAEYNLSVEPKLVAMRSQVASLYEEANKLKTELAKDKSKLDETRQEFSLDVLNIMLKTEAAKSEEESEQTADDFCEGKMDMDTFLQTYVPSRTLSHLRQTKAQKMNELVRQHSPTRNVPQNNYTSWSNSDIKSGGAAPYPSYGQGQYTMPQPDFYAR